MLAELFLSFIKIGVFSLGGGTGMLPVLEYELITKHHWLTGDELLEIMALAQMTPGTIVVNLATLIGYRIRGMIGAAIAVLGVVIPAVIIIAFIFYFLSEFFVIPIVQKALTGFKAALIALIVFSVLKFFKTGIQEELSLGIFLGSCVLLFALNVHPMSLMIVGGIEGILLYLLFPYYLKDKY